MPLAAIVHALSHSELLKEGFEIVRGPIVEATSLPVVSEKHHYKGLLRSAGNIAAVDGGRGKREVALSLDSYGYGYRVPDVYFRQHLRLHAGCRGILPVTWHWPPLNVYSNSREPGARFVVQRQGKNGTHMLSSETSSSQLSEEIENDPTSLLFSCDPPSIRLQHSVRGGVQDLFIILYCDLHGKLPRDSSILFQGGCPAI